MKLVFLREGRCVLRPLGWLGTVCFVVWAGACNTNVPVHDVEDTTFADSDSDSDSASDSDDTAVACGGAGDAALVCDTFEHGLTAAAEVLNGTVTLTSETVFAGVASVAAETVAEQSWATLVYPFTPIDAGTVYFAVHLFIPQGTVQGTIKLLNLSGYVDDGSEQSFGVDVNVSATRSLDIYVHGNYTRYESNPELVPEGEWFCVEGRYSISDVSGEASVWLNESLVVSTVASQEAVITGGVSELRVGIGWTENGQQEATVFVDNLAAATEPVSCF